MSALLLAGILVAASCADDDGDDGDGADDASQTETTAADDPPGTDEQPPDEPETTDDASPDTTGAPDGTDTSAPDDDGSSSDASEVDRSGRFAGLDYFCEAASGDPAEEPQHVDDGITADEIVITHVRVKLEDLAGLGFAVDIGDVRDQAETFVDVINEECGGIHGRTVALNTIEMDVPGLSSDADADAQRICIEAAEDQHAVAAYSMNGAAGPLVGCLTGAHDVIFLTNTGLTQSDLDNADGRLFSVAHAPSDMMRFAVAELADELEGKRIGVVHQDVAGDPQIVQQGLVQAIENAGLDLVRVDVLGCNNSASCTDNVIPSVQGMIADGVEVIFPALNTISLPGYLQEMVTQGVEPGQFQFVNTSFHAQNEELVSGKVVEFGGAEAGELYDGATIISATVAGAFRLPDYEPPPFQAMCNQVYAEHSDVIDEPYDPYEDNDASRFGSTGSQCHAIRLLARAIDDAGPNPTREDVAEAMGSLGGVDLGGGGPASYTPGKPMAPDAITRGEYRYPCPFETTNEAGSCMVPEMEYLPIPEG